ncbi:hypothetical protein [Yoonia sp. SS1-5]|uniref:Uncharacterized protein n=1 Tax=Yoonia rhodophyticola TaxID=3137370 RepID=A0AAN0M7U4_9RHOB
MRLALPSLLLLAACSGEANHLGNPLLWPLTGAQTAAENLVYQQRRGEVEILVKSNFAAITRELEVGDGPTLQTAMATAGIPENERPARLLQLRGDRALYQSNPGALVTALMVYGSS